MSKIRVTTGNVKGKLGDTYGSFVSAEDYFDLLDQLEAAEKRSQFWKDSHAAAEAQLEAVSKLERYSKDGVIVATESATDPNEFRWVDVDDIESLIKGGSK